MHDILNNKKQQLDKFRPLPHALVKNLDDWLKVELTYSSNAIEGNTLTRRETALVVEKGLTVKGKSFNEHLEAHNHSKALDFIYSLIDKKTAEITESDILQIHKTILQNIDDDYAGKYRNIPVRISGSPVILPNHAKITTLMVELIKTLCFSTMTMNPIDIATYAHYQLVTIHPFTDGNGRTARLLMNLILMQNGYPPAIIHKKQRDEYISSLEEAQTGGSRDNFDNLIANSIEKSLDIYLNAARGRQPKALQSSNNLLKIGQLAKRTKQSVPTIRFWTNQGLLKLASKTNSGYGLYDMNQVDLVEEILRLKAERFSITEIKKKLNL